MEQEHLTKADIISALGRLEDAVAAFCYGKAPVEGITEARHEALRVIEEVNK